MLTSLEKAERYAAFKKCINVLKRSMESGDSRDRIDTLDRASYELLRYAT